MYSGDINDCVEHNRRAILDLNRELVSIPSENRYPEGDEKDVQEFVEGYLGDLGCRTDTFLPTEVPGLAEHPAYLGGRNYEGRPNVVGKKEGTGGGRSILFSGHMDTVPRGEDPWSVDLSPAPPKKGGSTGWASST
jgi:acetylornithine deacetylase